MPLRGRSLEGLRALGFAYKLLYYIPVTQDLSEVVKKKVNPKSSGKSLKIT